MNTETEAEFASWVLDVARLYSWRVAHFRPARTAHGWRTAVSGDGCGFPDLVLIRGTRGLAVELKREAGTVTAEQQLWLAAFANAGFTSAVWRPRDRGAILELLA